jgi:hypothetical protein
MARRKTNGNKAGQGRTEDGCKKGKRPRSAEARCRADKVYLVDAPGLKQVLASIADDVHSGLNYENHKSLCVVDVSDLVELAEEETFLKVHPKVTPLEHINTRPLYDLLSAYLMRVWLEPAAVYVHPPRRGEAHPTVVIPSGTPVMDVSSYPPEFDTLLFCCTQMVGCTVQSSLVTKFVRAGTLQPCLSIPLMAWLTVTWCDDVRPG